MLARSPLIAAALSLLLLAPAASAQEDSQQQENQERQASPGLADLDKATELKITSQGMTPQDLQEVIDLLDSALDKGLDEENTEFAEEMLAATLMQKATAYSAAALRQRASDPPSNPRWVQLRQIALSDLQRAVEIDPSLTEAHLLIGRLQTLPLGDPNAARRALTKVIEAEGVEDDKLAQAYALRSMTQDEEEARADDLSRAVELDPEKTEYVILRARHHLSAKEYDAALAAVDKAIELAPENHSVHELKAMVLLAQEKLDEALASFDKASELEPDDVSPYQFRSQVYEQMGESEKALEQLNKAVELEPDNPVTLLIRAELHARGERNEEALADVQAALRQQPGSLRAHLMRTQLLDRLGRDDEALEALEKLAEAAPQRPEIQLQLGAHYMDLQRPAPAIDAFTRVLELVGDNELAFRMRGDMYLRIGKHAEALSDFSKAMEMNPDDSGLLNNYAWTLATSPFDELRDGQQALELARKACELTNYEASHILSTLAAAHAEVGNFDKAVEWSQKAVDLGRENDDPQLDQLSAELASYKDRKPWRELQQMGDSATQPPPAQEETDQLPPLGDAPARSFDF